MLRAASRPLSRQKKRSKLRRRICAHSGSCRQLEDVQDGRGDGGVPDNVETTGRRSRRLRDRHCSDCSDVGRAASRCGSLSPPGRINPHARNVNAVSKARPKAYPFARPPKVRTRRSTARAAAKLEPAVGRLKKSIGCVGPAHGFISRSPPLRRRFCRGGQVCALQPQQPKHMAQTLHPSCRRRLPAAARMDRRIGRKGERRK